MVESGFGLSPEPSKILHETCPRHTASGRGRLTSGHPHGLQSQAWKGTRADGFRILLQAWLGVTASLTRQRLQDYKIISTFLLILVIYPSIVLKRRLLLLLIFLKYQNLAFLIFYAVCLFSIPMTYLCIHSLYLPWFILLFNCIYLRRGIRSFILTKAFKTTTFLFSI